MTSVPSRGERADAAVDRSAAASYYLLGTATGILVIVGLAVVLSSSSIASITSKDGNAWYLFWVQAGALLIGLVALVVGSRLTVSAWIRLTPLVLYGAIVLLVLVLLVGISSGGNTNWIAAGPVTMQPSEIAKLGLALYLAFVLSRFRHELVTPKRIFVPGGLVAMGIIGLVLWGGDLGTGIVLSILTAAAFWVAGVPLRFFALGAGVLGVVVTALVFVGDTRLGRISTWLSDSCDTAGDCYQQTHGTWALASGGLWGLGPGMSREKWGYLPAADNDFIYAILGEEWGLVGTILVLIAYALLIVAVSRIVSRHRDAFAQIAAAAIGAWLIGQALINIAVVLELLPVTGVPLPLVSSGGSSLVMSLAGIGVLMALARSEPGAREAFAARPSMMRRTVAIISTRTGSKGKERRG